MEHQPQSSSLSIVRLCPPRGLIRRLRAGVNAVQGTNREDLPPGGLWIEDHGRFLLEEAEALRQALGRGVKLPGAHGVPRVLSLAGKIVTESRGEITAPLIVRMTRGELAGVDITQEELGMLPRAVQCALLEALLQAMEEVLRDLEEAARAEHLASAWLAGRSVCRKARACWPG